MSCATVAAGALSRASAPAQLRRGSLKTVARPASRPTARRLAPAAAMTDEGLAAQARAEAIKPRDDLPEVLIAGGGIAGLITALALQRKGMKVKVFEKVKEYKLFGGPIQLQCNAQGALDSIAPDVLEQVWEKSTITGDRINGLLDGVAGDWFYRFDTRKPCYENGLPLTLVIARYDLLEILRDAVGAENIEMETVVAKYENVGDRVRATLTDGTVHEGDVLIGADGIRSKMRAQMRDEDPENPPLAYAGYAVYTAICDYSAPHREPQHTDVEKTGYQVFLGPKQYFVSSDVGNGQQQYYAFLDVPPGGEDKYAKCEDWEITARCSWIASRAGARRCWSAWSAPSPRTWSVATCSTCCRIRGGWTGAWRCWATRRTRCSPTSGRAAGRRSIRVRPRRRAFQVRG